MMDKKLGAGWKFDNSYARLPDLLFTRQEPTAVRAPKLAVLNESLAAELGIDIDALRSDEGAAVLAGNEVPDGSLPLAQAYAGHQFGYFTMLGDGRALLLGEHMTPLGKRVDIQLKGSGVTPYSRNGDGRASLGPMLREYIISEAMFALGIPTTRSLAVVTTGQSIIREEMQPGAILTRVAASHIRVGTFQYVASKGSREVLEALADYTFMRHYPEAAASVEGSGERHLTFLKEVIKRQATLIAQWQLVGFIHGVMNTDNMAISGETIDYGPCAFMDMYNPATVFSSIDRNGRYAYGNQPQIAGWNLARFAECLVPLLHQEEDQAIKLAEGALADYAVHFRSNWLTGMRAKLGIANEELEDEQLIDDLLELMRKYEADYTNTFRAITIDQLENAANAANAVKAEDAEDAVLFETEEFMQWQVRWRERLDRQQQSKSESVQLMRSSNPAVIPRNHRVEEALEAAVKQQDYSVMERLLDALADPYAYTPEQAEYAALPAPSSRPYRTYCGT